MSKRAFKQYERTQATGRLVAELAAGQHRLDGASIVALLAESRCGATVLAVAIGVRFETLSRMFGDAKQHLRSPLAQALARRIAQVCCHDSDAAARLIANSTDPYKTMVLFFGEAVAGDDHMRAAASHNGPLFYDLTPSVDA